MSGTSDERDTLAAEYVLGTLDPSEARNIAARAANDHALAAAIADWEERLAPLSALAPAVPPPPALWDRLAASIAETPAPKAARTPLRRSLAFWRATTAAGFALAAAFAGIAFLRQPEPPSPARPVAALVPASGAPAAFIAEMQRDGTMRLVALEPVRVAEGRDLELWALPPGATQPVSLGVIPAAGRDLAPSRPAADGTQLMVSLEPRGGSPTGLPTGPVLYAGVLRGGARSALE